MTSTKLSDLPRIPRGTRLTGDKLAAFERQVRAVYAGEDRPSTRLICEATGRSYGAIYRILATGDVKMRPRGGQSIASSKDALASRRP